MRLLAASAGQQVELLQVKAKSDLVLSLARAERGRSRGFPRLVDQLRSLQLEPISRIQVLCKLGRGLHQRSCWCWHQHIAKNSSAGSSD